MPTLRSTLTFPTWLANLRDRRGAQKIVARLVRLEAGNPGVTKSVGGGVSELKIDFGPGYRVYFTHQGQEIVILLCGGDKNSQQRDIKEAQAMAQGP